ncbi:MAG: DUF3078 domain-containing protein [Saprospiraceae bacterium]|nr:DUF3078 domain-containing protein [Saprospiraceae bacterium]
MSKKIYLLPLVYFLVFTNLMAQEEQPPEGWTTGAGIGLDFSQLFQLNPRQGAGQNRIGFGGAVNFFANYAQNRLAWDNVANWQFGVQKLGSGTLSNGERIPFQKSIDELRLNSKIGYSISEESKFFYAFNMGLLTQMTPTYRGTDEYPGNLLSDITNMGATPLSEFFSPATLTFSAGIDYKPNEHLSIFYSPAGGKFIIVADDAIAALGVHGNPVERDDDGNIISFDNAFVGLGSLLRVNYADNFLNERLAFTSSLVLFSNYLENPQNIDIDWNNELALNIWEGLQLSMTLNIFYDDDVLVQISDSDAPGGVSGLGKRVSLTEQLLIKYTVVF